MVSSIPGIEAGPPDRTLTSSGSFASPKRLPTVASSRARCLRISSSRSAGQPSARYAPHAAVEIVNPGGTGIPSRPVMIARLAPLPPRSAFNSSTSTPWG
jgi:hypothetical protein